jgi:hypothetical protein
MVTNDNSVLRQKVSSGWWPLAPGIFAGLMVLISVGNSGKEERGQ